MRVYARRGRVKGDRDIRGGKERERERGVRKRKQMRRMRERDGAHARGSFAEVTSRRK